jgi:tetratricopeptide (TPR) repeat protein
MTFQRISLALAICLALTVSVGGQSPTPLDAGVLALQAGDFDKAASIFADALRHTPRDPSLHMGAGVAAHLRGHDDEARTSLMRALELEPRYTAASTLLGEIAYQQGDVELAIHIYEQALKFAPTSLPIRNALKAWHADAAKERRVDGPFSIAFDGPAEARLATHANAVLDAAYWRIGKALGAYPSQPIEVIFYTQKQFHDLTGAPEWAAGLFDTRIRIPVQGALAEPRTFDRVLTHELAHAMNAGIAAHGVPAWLHEGLAQYLEQADVSRAEQRWRASGTLIPLEYLQDGFSRFDARQARVAYDQSLVAASVLMTHLGPNVALLLHDLDRGNEFSLAVTRLGFASGDFDVELARRLK